MNTINMNTFARINRTLASFVEILNDMPISYEGIKRSSLVVFYIFFIMLKKGFANRDWIQILLLLHERIAINIVLFNCPLSFAWYRFDKSFFIIHQNRITNPK